jgi:predicted nicotinamide N-methyase
VQAAFGEDEYMPYWADLWPAARMLAKAILREPWPVQDPPLEALEIGCGLGLPGIAALAAGLRVIFTDYDATALRFAAENAQANGFERFRTLHVDWRRPPADLQVPIVLAADVVYELRSVAPLIAFILKVLQPGGVCLLTDSDRWPSTAFRQQLCELNLPYTTKVMHAGMPGRRVRGTLYRITRPLE